MDSTNTSTSVGKEGGRDVMSLGVGEGREGCSQPMHTGTTALGIASAMGDTATFRTRARVTSDRTLGDHKVVLKGKRRPGPASKTRQGLRERWGVDGDDDENSGGGDDDAVDRVPATPSPLMEIGERGDERAIRREGSRKRPSILEEEEAPKRWVSDALPEDPGDADTEPCDSDVDVEVEEDTSGSCQAVARKHWPLKRGRGRPITTGQFAGLAKAKRALNEAKERELQLEAERLLLEEEKSRREERNR